MREDAMQEDAMGGLQNRMPRGRQENARRTPGTTGGCWEDSWRTPGEDAGRTPGGLQEGARRGAKKDSSGNTS